MKPGKSSHFRLEKVYMDCIDEPGNCFIIYHAKLDIYLLRFIYTGLIFSDIHGATLEKSSLNKPQELLKDETIDFSNESLQIRGNWKRAETAIPLFKYKDLRNRELIWNCHHPKTVTEIVYKDKTYKGYGYAETITLSIKPWNLPTEELSWGRFLSDNYAVTWLNWKGRYPVNKIFCNGKEYNDVVYEAERISFCNETYVLRFIEVSVIRKGKLSNIFSGMPWIKFILNKRILNAFEIKYKASSALSIDSHITAKGWSLFETVSWKNQDY